RVEHALEDQLALPLRAHVRHVLPAEPVALAEVARRVARENGGAPRGLRVLEVRHAMPDDGAHGGAEEPVRMRDALPGQAQAGTQRRGEAGAQVVFAVA